MSSSLNRTTPPHNSDKSKSQSTNMRLSLRVRLVAIVLAAAIVPAVVVLSLAVVSLEDQSVNAAENKARSLARLVAGVLQPALEFDDLTTVEQSTKDLLKDPDVVYAVVLKSSGEILATASIDASVDIQHLASAREYAVEASSELVSIVYPITISGQIGAVLQIGVSLKDALAARHKLGIIAIIIVLALCGTLTLMLGLVLGRLVVRPTASIAKLARAVADGDLTQTRPDERGVAEIALLGDAVADMAQAIQRSVVAIKSSTHATVQQGKQVRLAASSLAAVTALQASAIAETTATLEQIKQTSQTSSSNAESIVSVANESVNVSQEGRNSVRLSVEQIRKTRDSVVHVTKAVEQLESELVKIDDINRSIVEIAEQSKLLAVNAAVEAASAKQHGAGFAVVASEVKALSEQSKLATAQVRTTVASIQKALASMSQIAQDGRQEAETSVAGMEETGEVIGRLSESIDQTALIARKIMLGASEQAIGIDQIAKAMSDINHSASENKENTEMLDQSGIALENASERLFELVARYRV